MAATYQWKWLRGPGGSPLTVKVDNAATALGITYSPVLISSNVMGVPTQGCELLGVAIPSAAASETNVPVIVGADNIFEVQVASGTDLAVGDPVQVEADGSVDTLTATNACVGCVVDYNPASGGIAHIKAVFNALNGAGVNDAATKMPLAGGTFTGDVTMTGGENIILSGTTGTKIGTATTQKLGFFNATPVVQPAATSDVKDALAALGLIADSGVTPLNLDGGAITAGDGNVLGGTTITEAKDIVLGTTTGTKIGTATTQKLAFRGSTPIALPAAAAQAACPAGGTGDPQGAWDTAQHRDDAIALINAMRTVLIDHGLMKGSA